MPFKKLKLKSPEEYRRLFERTYCNKENPIVTFDNITVKFYADMFGHAFFESAEWKYKDKSIFSFDRTDRMLWIKETLESKDAILKKGWDRKSKTYI